MKNQLSAFALALPMLIVPLQAQSFWSMYGMNIHQRITMDALALPFDVLSEKLPFELDARVALEKGVQLPDDPKKTAYSGTDHFDSELFAGSLTALKERRRRLLKLLSGDTPHARQAEAWKELGFMLHAIQDFYSHSTWVRVHSQGTADFFSLTSDGAAPPSWAKTGAQIGGVCSPDRVTFQRDSGKVTTGYFDPKNDTHPPVPTPAGKCEHGDVFDWVPNCGPGRSSTFGLALDSECSVPSDAESFYHSAKARAQTETRDFITGLIQQLVDAGKIEGACALLGRSLSRCPVLPACSTTDISRDWKNSFVYRITQKGYFSQEPIVYDNKVGGDSYGAVFLDLVGGTTGGSAPRLRLRAGFGQDAFHVGIDLRTSAPYEVGTTSYVLAASGHELWNARSEDCLFATYLNNADDRRGCFAFRGTMSVVSKKAFCARDNFLFSNMEVSFEGESPVKDYGADSLGPVVVSKGNAKGVFIECARGAPTPVGATGNDKFTCILDEKPAGTPITAN
jgi:hypothetical protein